MLPEMLRSQTHSMAGEFLSKDKNYDFTFFTDDKQNKIMEY